jgi:hypothetical protein
MPFAEDPETSESVVMRKEYGKVLRERFTTLMKHHLPHFKSTKYPAHPRVWPGQRIFRWVPREPIHCFVILVPDQQGYDDFTVEIGCSLLGRYPESSFSEVFDVKDFSQLELRCRVPWLLPNPSDYWWGVSPNSRKQYVDFSIEEHVLAAIKPLSAEEAQAAVVPVVTEAMQCLLSYGIPYLEEFVKSRS